MTKRILLAIAFGLAATACSSERTLVEDRTITRVKGVFYHEQSRYTLFVEEGGKYLVPITFDRVRAKIVADVAEDHEMWAHVRTKRGDGYTDSDLVIHVHSIRDINGAGWSHGKFGRGTTTKIAQ